LLDLIDAISGVVGRRLDYDLQVTRAGDVRDSLASMERARRVLGFEARVSLEEGLRETWNWFSSGAAYPARRQALPAEQPAA
jgi:UDP-glucose 4-epimerase